MYKLLNNAIYGKIIENVRNVILVKLVNNEKDYLKNTSKPGYMSHKIFGNNLVAIRKSKLALKLNKPAHTGMCILELSKVLMYEFHYDYIKNKFENKSTLLFPNTDSLMYENRTEDVYEDFIINREMFRFSNYSSHNEYKDALLNNKCVRHSINIIQSKIHRIGTYDFNKVSLPCFDDKNIYSKQWI